MSVPGSVGFPKLNRRKSIQLGASGVAAGLLSSEVAHQPAEARDPPSGPQTTPFLEFLPVYTAKIPVGSTPDSLSPAPLAVPEPERRRMRPAGPSA